MEGTTEKKAVNVWVDPLGWFPSTLDRVDKEDPYINRVRDVKESDCAIVESDEEHFADYHYNFDKYYHPFEDVPDNNIGLFCPFYSRAGSKIRAFTMHSFAEKMFPDIFNVHPLTFNYPERKDELIAYMKEHPDQHFIAKTDNGVCAAGIKIIHTPEDLELLDKDTEYAVQYYVNDPLLFGYKQRKIDFRISFTQVWKDNQNMVYFSTRHQGRIAPDPYEPLSAENKNNISSHITCYDDYFKVGYEKYFPT